MKLNDKRSIKDLAQKYLHDKYGEWGQGSDERAKIFMAFEAGWAAALEFLEKELGEDDEQE